MRFSDLPIAARAYVAVVCGLTLGVLALGINGLLPGGATSASLELTLLITLAATVAHSFPVSTPGKQAYHVSLPIFVAAAVVLSPLQLLACIGVVNAVEHVRRRRSAFAQLFNAAAYALSALASQVTYHALWNDPQGGVDLGQPGCLLAGLIGAAAFICVNRGLVSVAIWLGNRIPLREQHMFDPESLLTDAILLLMGLPLAHLAALAPWAAAVGAAPLWLIHRVLDLPNVRAQRRQDGLTELFTAPYLTETCTRELNRAKRFGRSIALVLLDVDGLGELNATFGSQAGDAVIRGTAAIIRKATREYDLAARLAGGMFAVLLPETDLAQAQVVAERMRRAVAERRHELADSVEQVRVTVSIGAVVVGGAAIDSSAQLFAVAESALANAKRSGGNRVEFATVAAAVPAVDAVRSTRAPILHLAAPIRALPGPRAIATSSAAANVLASILGVLAVCAGAWALVQSGGEWQWATLGLLVALAMLAETRSLDLFERSSFAMSSVPLLAACVLLGPAGAALLAPAIALVRLLTRRTRWQRVVVDASSYLLAGVAAALTFAALGGPPSLDGLPRLVVPALAAGLVFYLHTLPIAVMMAIELRAAPHRVWLDHFRWLWPQFVALGGLGLLLAVAYHVFGLIGAAAFVVPPLVMRYVTQQYLERAVDNVRHLRSLNEQLEHRAFHDPLTNLANRALFAERLEHAFRRAEHGTIAVLFLDLDNFKVVNDTLGHAAGDTLLTIVTHRLRQCVRWEDTIARLGGDEFTVLLENVRDVSDAARSAERIAEALRKPFDLDGQEAHVSASIGIALDTDRSHQPDDLLREADMAMYRAKSSGKSRYEIFDPGMNTHAMERLDLETDLRHAAQRGELELHYQPLVDQATGAMTALRAHLRWHHPRRGVLDATTFVPLAEETGLIPDLEHWALPRAAYDAVAWQAQLPNVAVHVRLAPRVFDDANVVDEVKAALEESGLAAALLSLGCMSLTEAAESTLTELRTLGVSTSIDNFASVAVSLGQLHRLSFQALTIDASTDEPVVRSIRAVADNLGIALLAEQGRPRVLAEVLSPTLPRAA